MENWYPVFWLVLVVLFVIAEAATVQLVSVWFALAAAAALLLSLTGVSITVQLIVFILVSCIALILTRPLARKLIAGRVHTNADAVIGMKGMVTETVENLSESGRAQVNGLSWSVRSASGETIPEGTEIQVLRIEGVKLIVSPCEAPENQKADGFKTI